MRTVGPVASVLRVVASSSRVASGALSSNTLATLREERR